MVKQEFSPNEIGQQLHFSSSEEWPRHYRLRWCAYNCSCIYLNTHLNVILYVRTFVISWGQDEGVLEEDEVMKVHLQVQDGVGHQEPIPTCCSRHFGVRLFLGGKQLKLGPLKSPERKHRGWWRLLTWGLGSSSRVICTIMLGHCVSDASVYTKRGLDISYCDVVTFLQGNLAFVHCISFSLGCRLR